MASHKGITIAFLNLCVIAAAIGVAEHNLQFAVGAVMCGAVPAFAFGWLIGLLAGATSTASPRWRTVLLSLPAFGVVAVLGWALGLTAGIPFACIPTLVAMVVLERWTRQVVPPPVPVATTLPKR